MITLLSHLSLINYHYNPAATDSDYHYTWIIVYLLDKFSLLTHLELLSHSTQLLYYFLYVAFFITSIITFNISLFWTTLHYLAYTVNTLSLVLEYQTICFIFIIKMCFITFVSAVSYVVPYWKHNHLQVNIH